MLVDVAAQLAALVRSVTHGLVVVANNSLGDESSVVILRVPANTLNSDGNVGSGHGVVTDTDIRANEVSLLLGQEVSLSLGSLAGKAGEVLLGKLNQLLVGNATGSSENHAVGSVVVLDVVGELGAGNVTDVLAGSKDGAAKRLVLESSGVQVVENNLLNLLLNLLGLSENDVAFALDGGRLQLGVLQDIGQDVDGLRDIGVEGLGEVDGVLALTVVLVVRFFFFSMRLLRVRKNKTNRGVGVQVATHVLNLELQLMLRSLCGTLETIVSLSGLL